MFHVGDKAGKNIGGRCEEFLSASRIQDLNASPILVPVVTAPVRPVAGVVHRTPKIASVTVDSCYWNLTAIAIHEAGSTGGHRSQHNGTTEGCPYAFQGFALAASPETQSGEASSWQSSLQSRLPAGLSLYGSVDSSFDRFTRISQPHTTPHSPTQPHTTPHNPTQPPTTPHSPTQPHTPYDMLYLVPVRIRTIRPLS